MRIGILGAGAIGCYVGGRLRAAGEGVVFCGRAAMRDELLRDGLKLTHYAGPDAFVPPAELDFDTTPAVLANADLVLLTVKSQATERAATDIAAHVRHDALVVSLQNGVRNAATLAARLPAHKVVGAMVPFNVVRRDGAFRCATEGDIVLAHGERTARLCAALNRARVPSETSNDMQGVLWAKLLLNLNNALNALSDRPIKEQLADRSYRRAMALCIDEGLAALAAAGQRPARLGKVLPSLVPHILRLPDFAFRIVARSMLRIDPAARSSMWQDLTSGRDAEIDYLNGEVVRLGQAQNVATPANARVVAMIREAFAEGRSPGLSGDRMLAELSGAD